MIQIVRLTSLCLFAALLVPVFSWSEDLILYTPKLTEAEQAPKPDEGVLVRSVTVKRGDTLKKLSRKYLGRSSWFPQVLVFNEIKNPNLIHPGEQLKVPVPAGKSASSETKGAPEKKHGHTRKSRRGHRAETHRAAATARTEEAAKERKAQEAARPTAPEAAEPTVHQAAKPVTPEAARPTTHQAAKPTRGEAAKPAKPFVAPASSAEQESFLQAKLAYQRSDYRKSLALFNDFLQKYPNSSSAADAALYRADCLLHLSGK